MKSLIVTRVLFTLISGNASAQQKRLAHLAQTLQVSAGQQQQD